MGNDISSLSVFGWLIFAVFSVYIYVKTLKEVDETSGKFEGVVGVRIGVVGLILYFLIYIFEGS
jgi:uncharacterized membrane protein